MMVALARLSSDTLHLSTESLKNQGSPPQGGTRCQGQPNTPYLPGNKSWYPFIDGFWTVNFQDGSQRSGIAWLLAWVPTVHSQRLSSHPIALTSIPQGIFFPFTLFFSSQLLSLLSNP